MKVKLIIFTTEDWYFWSHRLSIAKAALKKDMKVVVVTRVNKYGHKIRKAGFKLIPINIHRSSMNPIKDIGTFLSLVRIYALEKPDIIHNIALKPIIYASLAGKVIGVPVIINAFTGLGEYYTARGFKAHVIKTIINLFMKVFRKYNNIKFIFQNPDDLNNFVNDRLINLDQAFLIKGSGVNTKLFYPSSTELETEIPSVILASRMLWSKGVGDFVEASRILKKNGMRFQAVLVGKPDDMNLSSIPIQQLIKWNEEGVIKWLGWKEDMPSILRRSSIAVLPSSYGEGIPKFLIEAASSGLPIVTYDVPGCREIVRDGESGFLIPQKDISKLAEAIQKLLEDHNLRYKMGRLGRKITVNEFSEEQINRKTLELYMEYLSTYGNIKRKKSFEKSPYHRL